jgi:hypothetical protein
MIVRAVLSDPSRLESFDWFNDGKDTIGWLRWIMKSPEATELADKCQLYLERYHATLHRRGMEEAAGEFA